MVGARGGAHYFAQEHHIFTTDHIEAKWRICKALPDDDSLDGILEHDIGELVK
mgnify:CR=1 FL=1